MILHRKTKEEYPKLRGSVEVYADPSKNTGYGDVTALANKEHRLTVEGLPTLIIPNLIIKTPVGDLRLGTYEVAEILRAIVKIQSAGFVGRFAEVTLISPEMKKEEAP